MSVVENRIESYRLHWAAAPSHSPRRRLNPALQYAVDHGVDRILARSEIGEGEHLSLKRLASRFFGDREKVLRSEVRSASE